MDFRKDMMKRHGRDWELEHENYLDESESVRLKKLIENIKTEIIDSQFKIRNISKNNDKNVSFAVDNHNGQYAGLMITISRKETFLDQLAQEYLDQRNNLKDIL